MDIKNTLKPGENGTKHLVREYGDQLVCVRYRYDKTRGKRLKTVKLIVDVRDWMPGVTIRPEKIVLVRVNYDEVDLREKVKANGGYWDSDKKGWRLIFRTVLDLGLEHRLVDETLGF